MTQDDQLDPSASTSPAARVVLEVLDRVCRLSAGDSSQVDRLAALYAERTDVWHPMDPRHGPPLRSKEAIRNHFAAALGGSRIDRLEATDVVVHHTHDPEVVVAQFTYVVHVGTITKDVHNVFVTRVRDGQIIQSRDYVDHLGLATATGSALRLIDQAKLPVPPDHEDGEEAVRLRPGRDAGDAATERG